MNSDKSSLSSFIAVTATMAENMYDISRIDSSFKPSIKSIANYSLSRKGRVKRIKNRKRK